MSIHTWEFPYASIHYHKCSQHPWSCLDKLTHPGVWKHSSWDLPFGRCLPRVWPVSIYHNVQKTRYATFHSCYRCSYLMAYGSVVDGHEEAIEYCPISTATSTCYRQGDGFRDGSKNGRSVKSVLVRGLHRNPSSPDDTVTHPRKPEYSANHATRTSNLVTKEMTAYWYFYTNRL